MDRYLKKKIGLLEKKKRLKNHWKIDDILLIYWKYITDLLTIFLACPLPLSPLHTCPLTCDIFTKISVFYQYIIEISLISLIFCSVDNRWPISFQPPSIINFLPKYWQYFPNFQTLPIPPCAWTLKGSHTSVCTSSKL